MPPSGSLDCEVNVTFALVAGFAGVKANSAVGARVSIVTVPDFVALAPLSSVTWRRTVYVPAAAYDFDAVGAVPSSNAPSLSRSHACDAIVPSGSLEALESKVTCWPVAVGFGEIVKGAAGARFETASASGPSSVLPLSSVTWRRTV